MIDFIKDLYTTLGKDRFSSLLSVLGWFFLICILIFAGSSYIIYNYIHDLIQREVTLKVTRDSESKIKILSASIITKDTKIKQLQKDIITKEKKLKTLDKKYKIIIQENNVLKTKVKQLGVKDTSQDLKKIDFESYNSYGEYDLNGYSQYKTIKLKHSSITNTNVPHLYAYNDYYLKYNFNVKITDFKENDSWFAIHFSNYKEKNAKNAVEFLPSILIYRDSVVISANKNILHIYKFTESEKQNLNTFNTLSIELENGVIKLFMNKKIIYEMNNVNKTFGLIPNTEQKNNILSFSAYNTIVNVKNLLFLGYSTKQEYEFK